MSLPHRRVFSVTSPESVKNINFRSPPPSGARRDWAHPLSFPFGLITFERLTEDLFPLLPSPLFMAEQDTPHPYKGVVIKKEAC